MKARGFTLIEVLLVAGLTAALAGMAAPLFQGAFRRVALASAADGLRDAFALARDRAIRERRAVRVAWTPEGSAYSFAAETGPGLFAPLQDRAGRRLPAGVTLRSDAGGVTFFPDGTATPARVRLSGEGGDAAGLRVEPALGRAMTDDAPL